MLNIESFVPTEVKISRRRDCNGCRTTEKPLFPGYIFLRFDPEEIHTTTFTEIPEPDISSVLVVSLKQ
jgi:transcriptional antiterminator RfaH